ncbi:hypothetical protein [Flavobacterium sp.]|uniref:hypothetical protein n=1 Tax=Flavobacterium sp. TaxID=239 RepID=UPI00260C49FF|nr:hypothetical protein [Flavobacterium sp.]
MNTIFFYKTITRSIVFVLFTSLVLSCQSNIPNATREDDDNLKVFLNNISFADSLPFKKINFEIIESEALSKREVAFRNDSTKVVFSDFFWGRRNLNTYEADSIASFLYFNDNKIETYATDEALWSLLDFDLPDPEIRYYNAGDGLELFLFKGKSFTSFGHFAHITHGYLIAKIKKKVVCFDLSSYNVPGDFYIGKMKDEIVYLDIASDPIDKSKDPYIYEIKLKRLNFKKVAFENIYYRNKIVELKIAIPTNQDYTKYEIISGNWWPEYLN